MDSPISMKQCNDEEVCEEMAEKYEVTFLYRDFRPGFRVGQAKAKDKSLPIHLLDISVLYSLHFLLYIFQIIYFVFLYPILSCFLLYIFPFLYCI